MLTSSDIYRQYTWIGIDPGSRQCGISVFKVSNNDINTIEAFTIINSKIRLGTELTEENYSERNLRISKLCESYKNVLDNVHPIVVCCESPFFNPLMPSAYGSLTETVTALRLQTQLFNAYIPFISYSPQEVKQTFKQSGQIGKVVMKDALMNHSYLRSRLLTPIETLDEHSIDAIAVGYTWWTRQTGV